MCATLTFCSGAALAVREGLSAQALAVHEQAHDQVHDCHKRGRRSSCASASSDLSELLASEFSYCSLDQPFANEIILTTSARSCAAQSGRAVQAPVSEPFTPMAQIALTVASVRAALACHDSVVATEVEEGARGWFVTVHVAHGLSQFDRERILEGAQALLLADHSAKDIYLLRSTKCPFMLMPSGFGASLAILSDGCAPCHRSLEQGFCNAKKCRFQHPKSKVGVTVSLKEANVRR
jgi:hypothetical protein